MACPQGAMKESYSWLIIYLTYHLRHIDGHHKPIKRRFVINGSIDGYCDLSPTLRCSTNNKSASTIPKYSSFGSSHPEVFLGKGVLKKCSKFTGEHPCRSAISIKSLCNFTGMALRHRCSPGNLLHIFRTPFYKRTCLKNGQHLTQTIFMLSPFKNCCIWFPYSLNF